MLDEAASAIFDAMMQTSGLPKDENKMPSPDVVDDHMRLVERAVELQGEDAKPELRLALQQVGQFVNSVDSARAFADALGFGEDDEE